MSNDPAPKAAKATAKEPKESKASPAPKSNPNSLLGNTATVSLSKLKTYPGNPRRGDVNAIAESLLTNKQFDRPLVQLSTGYVLAGNHTLMAARKIKWPTLDVEYLDVDDEAAKRIVIAANRLPDLGGYDNEAMRALLTSLPDPMGTGYTDDDFNRMLAISQEVANDTAETALSIIHRARVEELAEEAEKEEVDEWAARALMAKRSHDADDSHDALLDAPEELPGVIQLAEEPVFTSATEWNIPVLRSDMLIQTLPAEVETWAGYVTRGDTRPDVCWLYNFGSETTKGMLHPEKMLLAFYAYDYQFEPWWWNVNAQVTKALNSGVTQAITPNWSQEVALPHALYNLYRSRYVGRYMQEAGIRVMPDLEVADDPRWYGFVKATLPKDGVPWAAFQVQNVVDARMKKGKEKEATPEFLDAYKEKVRKLVDAAQCENLLVYGNTPGFEMIEALHLPCNTRFVFSRLATISQYQSNMRKLGAATPKGPAKL